MLYPLKFHPIYKDKIWGGEKIRSILNKDFTPLKNCGESWEVSGYQNNESIVKNGSLAGRNLNQIVDTYKERLLGYQVNTKFNGDFPLLIKFIEANEDLSIQVHPDDKMAQKQHQSFGKTEMWYIIQADEGATLYTGFNRQMDKDSYLKNFNEGTLLDILNIENVYADDVFFIPAGRIHTIGKGILLTEIQQSSDLTYRIYDFDRKDQMGNKRELHLEEALDAMDYNFYKEYKTSYKDQSDTPFEIVKSQYFTTNKLLLKSELERNISDLDSFVIYICLEGSGFIKYGHKTTTMSLGDVILIPAELRQFILVPENNWKLLETYITKG
jgi:mannose-6-phosphate isomerase